MTISELKRNDVAGAIALYAERLSEGRINPDLVRSLLRLQDDPSMLLIEMRRVNPTPAEPTLPVVSSFTDLNK